MRKVSRASAIARAMATALHYVKDTRLLEAQRLVRAGRVSINAIVSEVGYGRPRSSAVNTGANPACCRGGI